MKTRFTLLFLNLLAQAGYAQLQSEASTRWRTTIEMGVQMGRVRPDAGNKGYWYGYNSIYYPLYPTTYAPRPAGNRIGLTIRATQSYILSQRLGVGLATGVNYYNNSAFFPVAALAQGNLMKHERRISPFYSLENGYAFRGPNPHDKELKGGWLWSPGLGVRIHKGNGTAFLISAGYTHQEARQVASVDGVQILSQVEYRRYNRLFFRMGFSF